jgi:hypothetical protein
MSIKTGSLEAQKLQISGKFEVFKTLGYVGDDVVSSCPPGVCVKSRCVGYDSINTFSCVPGHSVGRE